MIWGLLVVLVAAILLYAVIGIKGGGVTRGRGGNVDRAMVAQKWQTITLAADAGGASLKDSVMEADKLLDYVMMQSGFPGQTMGERLKSRQSQRFSDLNGVWRAHKLRNSYAHDIASDLVVGQAKEAIREFERGLKDLGAL